ncbi:Protein-tyrosine-phosphatase (Wzb) (PDB:4D74) (PUBMED:26641313) [Commensalibacter communis]|uniref:low molecular weight protein-tyrosine-phosphatase n=1 Tax=Commensalibacter communis TaxID=2972786 RepID=UPI0022FF975A|nr:low molecular weight protein-tyrosine-phosphatase [Commensalibacter communis]CAI3931458.1 Protein-tyrosine-phosphatase (Wzb) (PDB:4D74) (PUBMED:26641313) [Commensalibacter communis]
MHSSFSVLFVCLGNICRSPMAEAAFINEIQKRQLHIKVDSAGLGSWHVNNPPDRRTIKEAAQHKIDITHYRGRQIQSEDFVDFTHIIGMDHKNIYHLKKIAPPECLHKISLLMDYSLTHKGQEIADPYHGDQLDFEVTWKQVELGIIGLADYFEKQL